MALAASSDSKMIIVSPVSSLIVQYPATNPGTCDTRGTSCSFSARSAASRSLIVTLTTTACMLSLRDRVSGRRTVGHAMAAAVWAVVVASASRAADPGSCEGR